MGVVSIEAECTELDCEAGAGAMVLWFLGELVLYVPILLSVGAVLSHRERRRFGNVAVGTACFILTLIAMVVITMMLRAEPAAGS
jgi:hypothetical protein